MPNYRRHYIPEAYIFITGVTHERIPFFKKINNVDLFFETLENVRKIYPFELYANVLLPDHFHWIIREKEPGVNFSKILHSFKRNFTLNYKKENYIEGQTVLWQKRFWDHVIRDESDLKNHLDYIHWNPVKHKLVTQPDQYKLSSFFEFVNNGVYPSEWSIDKESSLIENMNFE